MLRPGIFALASLALVALAGCSSKGTVTGKVTYQDKPLTGGTVLFASAEGSQSSPIGEDGTYTISNMPTGPAKISVETESAQVKGKGTPGPGAGAKGAPPPKGAEPPPEAAKSSYAQGPPRAKSAEKIPGTYADPESSGLTYTVTGGNQTHDIALK